MEKREMAFLAQSLKLELLPLLNSSRYFCFNESLALMAFLQIIWHHCHLQSGAMASRPLCEAGRCLKTCSSKIVQRGAGQPRERDPQGPCLSVP